jgi:hypothetical protein
VADTFPYLCACGATIEVPPGGAAECPSCGPLRKRVDEQIAKSSDVALSEPRDDWHESVARDMGARWDQ